MVPGACCARPGGSSLPEYRLGITAPSAAASAVQSAARFRLQPGTVACDPQAGAGEQHVIGAETAGISSSPDAGRGAVLAVAGSARDSGSSLDGPLAWRFLES